MRKTKIICTLGPATDDENVMRELILNGMSVARMNMSHGTHEDHRKRADVVKKLRAELDIPVALLLDTKGPEIRTKNFKNGSEILETGQTFTFTTDDIEGDKEHCSITFSDLPKDVRRGDKILVDDGLIEMLVTSITKKDIVCEVLNGGKIASHKGINVPGTRLSLPFISEQDKKDIAFAVEQDLDFIAASFTRSSDDILKLRSELDKNNCNNIRIIAKIENAEGVDNIDDIIRVSDGIMVARGDLGVEIPMEDIPILQKKLITKAYNAGKQVITATQMLDSMMINPRPTRAEATDVANAIYDGTSAIMLSGETAAGKYPVQALKTMAKIAERTENDIDYIGRFRKRHLTEQPDVTSAISHATCTTAHDLGAVAIITVSKTGQTARMISKYRPACPIISGTTSEKVLRQMNLSWGVIPILVEEKTNTDELFEHVVDVAEKHGLVKNGDLAVITAGIPLGVSGTTNMLKVHLVGNVLVSGTAVTHQSIIGRICVCESEGEVSDKFKNGDIIVAAKTTNNMLPQLKKAGGIITEQDGLNSHAAIVASALDKPVIVGAQNAVKLLRTGTTVKLDGSRGIVFSANAAKLKD
ncbi:MULTISPECIES: pyruvate kinase [unclassified Ruminococcus]|uniref:pyruvate kinase n=1 Tax=unclassified Ruminococcus TaxID=2608920 RepID=UPI002109F760|nr:MULTISPECIES: pyruvate kinase [unclassified Ruminococcus]MCQ4022211.1 pyruvate kinase [Ruminococcus sp. zg-924]MCQ4115226.1 pyruvate kinase [Ruminococcus sp. zg-921]